MPDVMNCSDESQVERDKVHFWAGKSELKVHSIIAVALRCLPLSRDELVQEINRQNISVNPYGAIASLMTNKGNNYGRVFVDRDGILSIHPELEELIRKFDWSPGQFRDEP